MRFPRVRTILAAPLVLFGVVYLAGAIMLAMDDRVIEPLTGTPAGHEIIAIFGASGTAGDGILKAALADPDVRKIHVITRRATPRIEEGVAAGKVVMTLHMDYLDYTAVKEQIAETDTVFWAIGRTSRGVDQETYRLIHADFPLHFVDAWTRLGDSPDRVFHYISSSDISEDSSMMWAREKARAESRLIEFAEGRNLRVIAWRPDYIGPTAEEAHLGQDLLYGFFRPVGAAVRARQIGEAMLEVTARGPVIGNGTKIGTRGIHRYSEAYERRRASADES